jgi:hypothetical protein
VIDDVYPAMIREKEGATEVWHVPLARLGVICPTTMGKVKLSDGEEVLGVICEPMTVKDK